MNIFVVYISNPAQKGRIERNDVIKVGKAGAVLKALNVSDFDIVLFQETLDKATRSEKKSDKWS